MGTLEKIIAGAAIFGATHGFTSCNKGLREAVDDLKDEAKTLKKENDSLKVENDSLKANQINFQGQLNQAFAIIEVNDRNVKQILAQLHEEIQNGGKNTPALLSQLLTFMTTYEQRIQALEQSDNATEEDLVALWKHIQVIQKDLIGIEQKVDRNEEYINDVEEQVTDTEIDIEKLKEDYNDCMTMILHLAKVVRDRKDEMTARLNTLEGKLETMEKIPALQAQIKELREEMEDFRTALQAAETNSETSATRFYDLYQRVIKLEGYHTESSQETEAEISRYGKEVVEAFNWARKLNLIEATSLEEFNPYGALNNGMCSDIINGLASIYYPQLHYHYISPENFDQIPDKKTIEQRLAIFVYGEPSSTDEMEEYIQRLYDAGFIPTKVDSSENTWMPSGYFLVLLKGIIEKMGLNTTHLWLEAMDMPSAQDSNPATNEE